MVSYGTRMNLIILLDAIVLHARFIYLFLTTENTEDFTAFS